ncbi:MAG: homoserine O-acetyltransferase/O-succinyltransferase family protein [Acidimicrobiales bacterium]
MDRPQTRSVAPPRKHRRAFQVAFVNNMPTAAFRATERQFLDLLQHAATGPIEFHRYRPGFAGPTAPPDGYRPVELLYESTPDALIVTGGVPQRGRVTDEPAWPELARLLEWSVHHTSSLIASCLAAHCALAAFDGVERRQLPVKRAGVLRQLVRSRHPMAEGLPATVRLPQSRYGDVPEEFAEAAGYQVLLASKRSGWTVASKRVAKCDVVLMQGHPEYDGASLILEYRRDLHRWLEGDALGPPVLPPRCAAPADMARLHQYHTSMLRGEKLDVPDLDAMARRAPTPWMQHSRRIYYNWVRSAGRKEAFNVA